MATARDVYEAVLIELNKVLAPSILLEDFNYLFNKAVYQYINKKYNLYDTNQQSSDDLRILKATIHLSPTILDADNIKGLDLSDADDPRKVAQKQAINSMYGNTYEVELPQNYMHVLNCICVFKFNGDSFKCYDTGEFVSFPAQRLTADAWGVIMNNFYMKPSYKRPYFYIHNNNLGDYMGDDLAYKSRTKEDYKTITLGGEADLLHSETEECSRVGNPSKVRMEIRYGKDSSKFELVDVQVDYIKVPQHIRLTLTQLDTTVDTSQIIEWPDYVVQEIINELVHIIMENASDPRLLTHIPISLSIASPAQQLPQNSK